MMCTFALKCLIQFAGISSELFWQIALTLIDGGPLECESSASTDELFSSTTITS